MIMIAGVLNEYAPTNYQELDREADGSVKLDDTKIVYMLPGSIQSTVNKVRKDYPLTIDIWYNRAKIYDIEDMVEQIDGDFSDLVWTSESGVIVKIVRDTNFTMNILDENPEIRRKQMNYVVAYYA